MYKRYINSIIIIIIINQVEAWLCHGVKHALKLAKNGV